MTDMFSEMDKKRLQEAYEWRRVLARDHFATMILIQCIEQQGNLTIKEFVPLIWDLADAMIAERDKRYGAEVNKAAPAGGGEGEG